jgi:indolepyruvate ferredoxin oxidoreductase
MLTAGSADLYLVFDLLVGVDSANLTKTDPQRSVAVVSTSQVATGGMIADTKVHYPDVSLLKARIDKATRGPENLYVDTLRMAEELIGDHIAGNMVLVGAAYQAGRLPLSVAAIEQAIRLNGAGIDMNLEAFRLGRWAIADPDRIRLLLDGPPPATVAQEPSADVRALIEPIGAQGEFCRLLNIRVAELVAYQDWEYARSYIEFVTRIRDIEQRVVSGRDEIACSVARNLYKLMAYKDEYEVARLLLLDRPRAQAQHLAGAKGKIYWHLHPSFLRSMGINRKVKLGPAFTPALKLLRAMKPLRGTWLDFFGRGKVRVVERALIGHYRRTIESAMANLTPETYARVGELANLPDIVRGYEDVKLGTVKDYLAKVRTLAHELGLGESQDSERELCIVADEAA